MKRLFVVVVALSLALNAAAEECVVSGSESSQGRISTSETCVGRVDDVIKTSSEGYVSLHYVVQYKGQRLIVLDPLSRNERAVGDQVSFMILKMEEPASARGPGFRALFAQTTFGSAASNEKSAPR